MMLLHDLRFAVRWLRRSPGFSAVVILSLGLGLGFNTALVAVVDALLLRPLSGARVADPVAWSAAVAALVILT